MMDFHQAADLFPLIQGQAFDDLVKDIRAHGLREPIILHPDGSILDGRNRYRACEELGIEPDFVEWNGKGSEVDFVLSLNLHRRHLNESQRAMVAGKIANMGQGGMRDPERANLPVRCGDISNAEAAQKLNVSERTVKTARKVQEKAEPSVIAAVEAGTMAVSTAVDVLELPPEEQVEIAALPEVVALVLSRNLHRRHLSESQRAMVAAKVANLEEGRPQTTAQICAVSKPTPISQTEAAKLLNVARRSVQSARQVQSTGAPELIRAVEDGSVAVSVAAKVASLPKAAQVEVVAHGVKAIQEAAKAIRIEKTQANAAQVAVVRAEAVAIAPPDGKYRCIVIDPPWPMVKIGSSPLAWGTLSN